MSGVLRLGNTGAGTGRSTLEASASNDQTFTLPSAGGTILTTNFDSIGTITWNGSNINITNADLNVNSGTLFVDESTNRVGIGTTAPSVKLHIDHSNSSIYDSSGPFTAGQLLCVNSSNTVGSYSGIRFVNTSGGNNGAGGIFSTVQDINGNAALTFVTRNNISGETEVGRFDSQGNFGIGTQNPLRTLHVAGAGDTGLMLQTTNAVNDNEIWEIQAAGNAINEADLIFRSRLDTGTGGTEVMRLTNIGNVGIGTTSPGTNLDVVGKIKGSVHMRSQIISKGTVSSGTVENLTVGDGVNYIKVSHSSTSGSTRTYTANFNSGIPTEIGTIVYLEIYSFRQNNGGTSAGHQTKIQFDGVDMLDTGYHVLTAGVPYYNRTLKRILILTEEGWQDLYADNVRVNTQDSQLVIERPNRLGGSTTNDAIAKTEALRINADGQVLVGTLTTVGGGSVGELLQIGFSGGSRAILANTSTSLASGALLGQIDFTTNVGSSISTGASIKANCDGTAGSGDAPTRLVFSTTADGASSPTERMSISQEGYIFPDDTSRIAKGNIKGTVSGFKVISASTNSTTRIECFTNATTTKHGIAFSNPNGIVGSISTNASATAYNTSSDYRLKENVVPLTGAADRINQLQVRRFNFIADPDKTVDGFIAHEAQTVVPECVTGTKDEVDNEGNPVYQGIDQSKLVPLLTAALQETIAKVEALEAEISKLRSK